MEYSRDLENI